MIDTVGVAGGDGEGVKFAVGELGNEGEIVFVTDDLGDFQIGFVEFFCGFRKINTATGCGSQIL